MNTWPLMTMFDTSQYIDIYTEVLLHIGAYWIISLSFLCVDLYWRAKGIYKYKVLETDRPFADNKTIVKAICVSLFNQILSLPLIYYMTLITTNNTSNNNDNTSYINIATCYMIYVLLADQWFYWTHRFMHMNKYLFNKVHRIHHEWKYPMSIRTIYAHPIEHLVSNLGSVFIGPLLFPLSAFWVHLWGLLALINSVFAHSGTKFFSGSHDMHHRNLLCNFGVLGLSDMIYGTYKNDPHVLIKK